MRGHPTARHLVLVLSAVNQIDSTALLGLIELNSALAKRGISLNLAEVKGPVMDRLRQSSLLHDLSGKLYLSTALATADLSGEKA
ncbi:STAS domain protein [compost metagenome]